MHGEVLVELLYRRGIDRYGQDDIGFHGFSSARCAETSMQAPGRCVKGGMGKGRALATTPALWLRVCERSGGGMAGRTGGPWDAVPRPRANAPGHFAPHSIFPPRPHWPRC